MMLVHTRNGEFHHGPQDGCKRCNRPVQKKSGIKPETAKKRRIRATSMRRAMKSKGVTWKEVAEKCGVTVDSVSKWMTGKESMAKCHRRTAERYLGLRKGTLD